MIKYVVALVGSKFLLSFDHNVSRKCIMLVQLLKLFDVKKLGFFAV